MFAWVVCSGLLALGNVIVALAESSRSRPSNSRAVKGRKQNDMHIPYRQSKLTRYYTNIVGRGYTQACTLNIQIVLRYLLGSLKDFICIPQFNWLGIKETFELSSSVRSLTGAGLSNIVCKAYFLFCSEFNQYTVDTCCALLKIPRDVFYWDEMLQHKDLQSESRGCHDNIYVCTTWWAWLGVFD